MARPGVTYTEVASAASHLMGQGKNPTIEQVRLLLGTGSSTTIANHLKQWREEQNGTSLLAAKENIPSELVAMLKGLWQQVMEQSELKIQAIQVSAEQQIGELQEELQKYKSNNQRWQQLFNQWTQEKEQLARDKLTLEQGLLTLQQDNTAIQAKHDGLTQQLQDKHERINELHRLHQQAQTNLEHYRESTREQRLIEQQQFDQQKQELQLEIKTRKEQTELLQEKLFTLQQQNLTLKQAHSNLEQTHMETLSQFETLKSHLVQTEKEKNEYYQSSQHWHGQLQQTCQKLETTTSQLIDHQAEVKILNQQLVDAKQSLNDALDQNKLFGHEKWLLAQEKAQLEGQIKQMQKMISA